MDTILTRCLPASARFVSSCELNRSLQLLVITVILFFPYYFQVPEFAICHDFFVRLKASVNQMDEYGQAFGCDGKDWSKSSRKCDVIAWRQKTAFSWAGPVRDPFLRHVRKWSNRREQTTYAISNDECVVFFCHASWLLDRLLLRIRFVFESRAWTTIWWGFRELCCSSETDVLVPSSEFCLQRCLLSIVFFRDLGFSRFLFSLQRSPIYEFLLIETWSTLLLACNISTQLHFVPIFVWLSRKSRDCVAAHVVWNRDQMVWNESSTCKECCLYFLLMFFRQRSKSIWGFCLLIWGYGFEME